MTIYSSDACGYCLRAKALLDKKGVDYAENKLGMADMDGRRMLVELTGRYTVPQILIDGRPIGGWDELSALERTGELDTLLAMAG